LLCNKVLFIGLELRRLEPRFFVPNVGLDIFRVEEDPDTNKMSCGKIRLLSLLKLSF